MTGIYIACFFSFIVALIVGFNWVLNNYVKPILLDALCYFHIVGNPQTKLQSVKRYKKLLWILDYTDRESWKNKLTYIEKDCRNALFERYRAEMVYHFEVLASIKSQGFNKDSFHEWSADISEHVVAIRSKIDKLSGVYVPETVPEKTTGQAPTQVTG
ncbi:MAG: hypothetical protein Q7S34_03765 [bacterium]|nr:hypothetical protein [bacterium]